MPTPVIAHLKRQRVLPLSVVDNSLSPICLTIVHDLPIVPSKLPILRISQHEDSEIHPLLWSLETYGLTHQLLISNLAEAGSCMWYDGPQRDQGREQGRKNGRTRA